MFAGCFVQSGSGSCWRCCGDKNKGGYGSQQNSNGGTGGDQQNNDGPELTCRERYEQAFLPVAQFRLKGCDI